MILEQCSEIEITSSRSSSFSKKSATRQKSTRHGLKRRFQAQVINLPKRPINIIYPVLSQTTPADFDLVFCQLTHKLQKEFFELLWTSGLLSFESRKSKIYSGLYHKLPLAPKWTRMTTNRRGQNINLFIRKANFRVGRRLYYG